MRAANWADLTGLRYASVQLQDEYEFRFLRYGGDGTKATSFRQFIRIYKKIRVEKPDIAHFSGLQVTGLFSPGRAFGPGPKGPSNISRN